MKCATLVKLPPQARRAELIDPDPVRNFFDLNQADKPIPGVTPPKPDLSKTTGFAVADPDPDNPDYKTPLSPSDELKFRAWVKANKVPFDDSASSDYDMRGFWKAAQEGDPNASTAVSKFDGKLHFNDTFKTPFHKTFSNESQYATSDAPHWVGDRLVDNQGNVVADETPPGKPIPGFIPGSKNAIVNPAAGVVPPTPKPAYPDQIVTPEEASGAKSIVNATAAPAAPAKVTGGEGFFGGDLTQGPPGTKPNGTENEPYWPKSGKDITLLPPGVNYIDPKDQSQKVTPGTPPVTHQLPNAPLAQTAPAPLPNAPVTQAAPTPLPNAPVTSSEVTQPATNDDYNKLIASFFPSAQTKAEVGTGDMPPMLNAPNGQAPAALIIHHTSGNNSAQSVVDDWRTNRPGVGAQMIMDRDGTIHYTQKEFGYNGTGNFLHSVIPGVSNQTAVGIEVIAKDDADMTPAQLQSLQRLAGPKGPYANVPVYGHSQVSPSDRENEGVRGVNAINEARSGAAPTGEPGTTPIETLVKLNQSGLNVTHFGYEKPGEEGWDKDSANGNGKYVKNLIPGYDVALNSAGAAMVGNPKPGETFTFAGKEFRYGDAVSEKLIDPRFDIFDPTGTALAGSVPIGKQVAASAPAQNKMPWDDWTPLSPADQAAAEKEGADFRTQQISALDKLNRDTPNPKQFWEKLQNPIEGVTDAQRQSYAENFKKEVTAHAQDFYGEKDPEKAFTKAISDPGLDAYITNIGRGLAGAVGQADIGIALAGKSIDRNRVEGFMNLVHPDSTGDGRAGFVKALTDIQDKNHRHDVFNELYGALPQNTKDAIGDPASILDSIDNLADPARQADLNKQIAQKKAWVDQQLAGSPELKGTGADWWTTGTGENLFNTVAALVPGGVGAVVRTTTLGSQMYSANMDRIAKEHPDYSPEQVSEEASKSAFMTLAPQEAVLAASHGLTAPLLKWAGSLAEKPIVRFGIGGGVQVGAAGVGGALGQVGANVAENKPLLQDVPQAAGSAIVQSLPFAVHGGVGALSHEVAPTEHGAPAEPAPAEPAPVEPAPVEPAPRAVTRGEILGPDEPPAPAQPRPWYMQGAEPGQDPLVIRGAERTTWTPQELSDLVDRAPNTPEGLKRFMEQMPTPASVHLGDEGTLEAEQTRQIQAKGGPSITLAAAIKKAKADAVAAKLGVPPARTIRPGLTYPPLTSFESPSPAHTAVYNDLIAGGMREARAANFVERARGTTQADILADVQTQMRERASGAPSRPLDRPESPPLRPGAPPPAPPLDPSMPPPRPGSADHMTGHAGVEEPWESRIANKYVQERTVAGEVGHVEPGTGKTTEQLLAQGLKMGPEEINQHMSDIMSGKGDPVAQTAAMRAEEARLSQRSHTASLVTEADPTNQQKKIVADHALKDLTDLYNGPMRKLKQNWHRQGVAFQDRVPIDLSTYNGIRAEFIKSTGKTDAQISENAKAGMKKAAKQVRESSENYKTAMKNVGDEAVKNVAEKKARGRKIPSIDQISEDVMRIMKHDPCPV